MRNKGFRLPHLCECIGASRNLCAISQTRSKLCMKLFASLKCRLVPVSEKYQKFRRNFWYSEILGEGQPHSADGNEVENFKINQSNRKWIYLSRRPTFFFPKNPFFLRKISNIWAYFTKISALFRKHFKNFKISIVLESPTKSGKFPRKSIIYLRNLSKI